MLDMYKGIINSPETTLTSAISKTDTVINVADETKVPATLPNTMTIGTGASAETVKVISITGKSLSVVRAFQGEARLWNAGTVIARNFTEYDYEALRSNIIEVDLNRAVNANKITAIETKNLEQDEQISMISNPNILINGGADFWQRGDLFTSFPATTYTADRWSVRDSPVASFEKVLNTCPQSKSKFAFKITCAGTYNIFCQPVENFNDYVGKEVTLSFWAKASAPLSLNGHFGGGLTSHAITTTWTKFSKTLTVAAASTVRESGLAFGTFETTNAGKIIEICDIKVEFGNVATKFISDMVIEQLKCQRYYINLNNIINRASVVTVNSFNFGFVLPIALRSVPTIIGAENTVWRVRSVGFSAAVLGFTLSVYLNTGNNLTLQAIKTAHGLPDAVIDISGGVGIGIDAEIY